jgi:hypothetical protein
VQETADESQWQLDYMTYFNKITGANIIATLSVICFVIMLAMWFGVDLNGRFLGMRASLASFIGLGTGVTGCLANCVWVCYQRRCRIQAIFMGLFCAYCVFDIARSLLS